MPNENNFQHDELSRKSPGERLATAELTVGRGTAAVLGDTILLRRHHRVEVTERALELFVTALAGRLCAAVAEGAVAAPSLTVLPGAAALPAGTALRRSGIAVAAGPAATPTGRVGSVAAGTGAAGPAATCGRVTTTVLSGATSAVRGPVLTRATGAGAVHVNAAGRVRMGRSILDLDKRVLVDGDPEMLQRYAPQDVRFEVLRQWRSPHSGASYPVAMAVVLGKAADAMRLELKPLMDDQELDARASTGNYYWEGAVRSSAANATDASRKLLQGRGYLELTGYWRAQKL